MSNYATKSDLNNVTHVDTSSFSLKPNLGNLKNEFDKSDINKLAPVPVDLSKLSNAVKMMSLKNKIKVKFTGSCLKQSNKLTYTQ